MRAVCGTCLWVGEGSEQLLRLVSFRLFGAVIGSQERAIVPPRFASAFVAARLAALRCFGCLRFGARSSAMRRTSFCAIMGTCLQQCVALATHAFSNVQR